jgi:phosphoserine phosphatase
VTEGKRDNGLVVTAGAHIFDVDHTLTRHATGWLFARTGVREGMFTWSQLARLPLYYVLYRIGRLSIGKITREIKPLRGYHRRELQELAERTWEESGRHDLYGPALNYLHACRADDAVVVIATSALDVIVKPLTDTLPVDHVVSSVLDYDQQDRSTGWLMGGPCYAEEKSRRIMALLEQLELDPAHCAFYTDSYHDLPGLRAVGYPVAVEPDLLLRRIATRERWPILEWNQRTATGPA